MQVRFQADQFTVNDPRLDKAFDISMLAVLTSTPLKHHHRRGKQHPGGSGGSTGAGSAAGSGADALSSSSGSSSTGSSSTSSTSSSSSSSSTTVSAALPSQAATAAAAEQPHSQEPTHSMSCAVDVAFTVTVPPPLSMVPGLLLSSTAGLIAKLTMQSLLPQFLELLAVDYQRWASGAASSRALPAGSLVPATAAAAAAPAADGVGASSAAAGA
jgi:hypothetical protein